jgi:GDP-D-mannose dehydratase
MKFIFDMNDHEKLEYVIFMVKPDYIIHLASESSSVEAYNHPYKTLQTGMIVAKLCELIKGTKIKLFNASSSEIYKGHQKYTVDDRSSKSINNTFHNHPYSIAKIMGQQIVQFYRDNHGLVASNGIIYTVHSERKSEKFLLNKVMTHAIKWGNGDKIPLHVGTLDSFRNILHPSDVVDAIDIILRQDTGDDYNICGKNSYLIYDMVIDIYVKSGILLFLLDNTLYETNTNLPVLVMHTSLDGLDNTEIDIRGYPHKLISLGWNPSNLDRLLTT